MPDEDMRIFLCTQIADEARHVAFFDQFFNDGRRARGGQPRGPSRRRSAAHLNPEFTELFDELLRRRVDRLAVEPEDLGALVEAVTIYHMVTEGMLALTGQHFILDYNERGGHAARVRRGLHARSRATSIATSRSALASCATWCGATRRTPTRIQRTLEEVGPAADGVLKPPWAGDGGATAVRRRASEETRAFALKALRAPAEGRRADQDGGVSARA